MLNLFLAILLGNFDRARNQQIKLKLIDNFQRLLNEKKYSLEKSINMILPDIPKHMMNFIIEKKTKRAKTMAS
jgi:hypothetical protein